MTGSGRHMARRFILARSANRTYGLTVAVVAVLGMAAAINTASPQPKAPAVEEEYGEFLAPAQGAGLHPGQ